MESNEENEYRNKLLVCAQSLADKMAILEARDRLMRLKRMRQTNLATAVAVVGTCPDMCPELERYFRQETNQLSLFEMDANTGRPDEHRMVKEYRRSGADQEEPLAHELRPTPVLNRTMDYLCTNIMDTLDVTTSCGEWYDFVWSRTRSIRKDITQQHLCDQQVVALTEKCARFHIHCSETLCEQNVKDFDPKINEENLSNCLQSLKDLYYDLSLRDIFCPNESEFRCYEILLHLNDTAIFKDVQNYRQQIRDSVEVQIAIKAFFAYQSNNYIKFFQLLDQCSYLMACILHRYFTPIRQKAFKILRRCYTSNSSSVQEYPAQHLISCLGFEDSDELKSFCDHIGLECGQEVIYLIRGQNQNNSIKAKRSVRLIEEKRSLSVGQVINGSILPTNPYKALAVHNSFDSDGKLKNDAIEAIDQKTKTIVNSDPFTHSEDNQKPNVCSNVSISCETNVFTSDIITSSFPLTPNSSYVQNSNTFFENRTQLKPITASNSLNISESPPNSLDFIQNQFQNTFDLIYDSIAEDMICDLVKEELLDICCIQFEQILNDILEQTICDIFYDIFLNTSDNMIKQISLNVIREETELLAEQMKIVDQLSVDIYEDFVVSEIKSISSEVFTKSREECFERQNILIANELFNDLINDIIKEIGSEVLSNETHIREEKFRLMREKTVKRLQTKYFFKWKDWFLEKQERQKRLKCLSQSFPAAPKWGSNKRSPNSVLFSSSDLSFDEIFNKSIERELLANNLLNFFIDTVIRDIASEVFDSTLSSKSEPFKNCQQKRVKRIQYKYFIKWKQFCAKKRLVLKRDSFPAAPNWTSNDSFCCKTKHSFSHLDPEIEISAKRLRRQVSPNPGPEPTVCASDSVVNLKPLFDCELSESRALTQRLTQEINCDKTIKTIDELNDKQMEPQFEKQDDIEVIQIFESQTDKINRLKRLLSEEKDYFSLQNFVQYLKDN